MSLKMLMNIRLCKVLLPLALLLPSTAPSLAFESFQNRTELRSAVDAYLNNNTNSSSVALKYGWPIGTWLVENVADFSLLFSASRNSMTSTFNEPLEEWNTSKATTMQGMFLRAEAYNQDLSIWDVSKVTDTDFMFSAAESFNQDLCDWGPKLDAIQKAAAMFGNTSCPNQASPDLQRVPIGPLCYNCPFPTCKDEGVTNGEKCGAKCKEVYPASTGFIAIEDGGSVTCTCIFSGSRSNIRLCSDGPGSAGATLQKGLMNIMVGVSVIIWMVLG